MVRAGMPLLFSSRGFAGTFAAMATLLFLAGCESGNQEPEAPAAEQVEFGAAPSPEPEAEVVETTSAAVPQDRGGIDASRFPSELPDGAVAAMPDNFPSEMPVYPNATPSMGMAGPDDGDARSLTGMLTNDSVADVTAYYDQRLQATGWDVTTVRMNETTTQISATNGSSTTLIMLREAAGGGTDIYQVIE